MSIHIPTELASLACTLPCSWGCVLSTEYSHLREPNMRGSLRCTLKERTRETRQRFRSTTQGCLRTTGQSRKRFCNVLLFPPPPTSIALDKPRHRGVDSCTCCISVNVPLNTTREAETQLSKKTPTGWDKLKSSRHQNCFRFLSKTNLGSIR